MWTGLLRLTMGLTMAMVMQTAQAADLVLESYFSGKTRATGAFGAINGVKRTFTVDLTGRFDGRTLVLREDFVFADGERDTKTWRFTKTAPGRYSGTREDVIGTTHVAISGRVARFNYLVNLGTAAKPNIVRFHDRMVLKDDGRLINTAWVTKFLFPVARTKVIFQR
ncbi:DUF3833 family protein [Rhizobium sp. SSA_523]|uniref:DUF3833 family protein n=1 Tax=Rhizobium sp. SSA_523 TaxID=2952477 RepID=UPI0020908A09|nr:DUF3833 family protein [Rhizobium sp. SSA_523]MCO5732864.1 DUF3833 domain-containing protein [Rhizobium sp. SSA_523]WKC23519.1 DUF3833 family protein [Rhizobium sp. SSA_523]